MRSQWVGILALLMATQAGAAQLHVQINDQRGRPVDNAVVTVTPLDASTRLPSRPATQTRTIDQVALTFRPYIEVFRPGDRVVFRNSDKTRHHVYSFSPVKAFEYMLRPGESSAALVLDKSGVVAVGCNIHDPMITYLYVSDAPWLVRGSKDGGATVADLPAGRYTIRVWQPRLRPGKAADAARTVELGNQEVRNLDFKLSLLPDARHMHADRDRGDY